MPLTKAQYIAINVANFISSPLSIAGSSTIISLILRRRRRRQHRSHSQKRLSTYDSIILLLCTGDLIISTNYFFQSFAVPRDTPGAFWAVGNTASCSMAGFISFFGSQWVAGCNAFLALYFCVSVRRGWKDPHDFTPLIKIASLTCLVLFPAATSAFAAYHKAFNFSWNSYICHLGDYPDGCFNDPEVDCQRGQNVSPVAFAWVAVILVFSMTGFGCTFAVYWRVRSFIQRSLRHSRRLGSFGNDTSTDGEQQRRQRSFKVDESVQTASAQPKRAGHCHDEQSHSKSTLGSKQSHEQTQNQSIQTQGQTPNPSSIVSRITASQKERLRLTAWQAVFYSLAYLNVFIWPFFSKLNHEVHNGQPGDYQQDPLWFALLLLTWFFYPIQGFLNFLIYIRPDILKWRDLNPDSGIIWILKQSVVQAREPIPSGPMSKLRQSSNDRSNISIGNNSPIQEEESGS